MSTSRERHSTVICTQAGHILFVRKEGPEWSLPGGKIDPGEQHAEAAERELMEETCLPLHNAQFINHHLLKDEEHYLYQMAVAPDAVPTPDHEILECRWFTALEIYTVQVKPSNMELLKREQLLPI